MRAQLNDTLTRAKMRVLIVAPTLHEINFEFLEKVSSRINVRICANFSFSDEENQKKLQFIEEHENFSFRRRELQNLWGIQRDYEEIVLGIVSKPDPKIPLEVVGIGSILEEHIKIFVPILEDAWVGAQKEYLYDASNLPERLSVPEPIETSKTKVKTTTSKSTTKKPSAPKGSKAESQGVQAEVSASIKSPIKQGKSQKIASQPKTHEAKPTIEQTSQETKQKPLVSKQKSISKREPISVDTIEPEESYEPSFKKIERQLGERNKNSETSEQHLKEKVKKKGDSKLSTSVGKKAEIKGASSQPKPRKKQKIKLEKVPIPESKVSQTQTDTKDLQTASLESTSKAEIKRKQKLGPASVNSGENFPPTPQKEEISSKNKEEALQAFQDQKKKLKPVEKSEKKGKSKPQRFKAQKKKEKRPVMNPFDPAYLYYQNKKKKEAEEKIQKSQKPKQKTTTTKTQKKGTKKSQKSKTQFKSKQIPNKISGKLESLLKELDHISAKELLKSFEELKEIYNQHSYLSRIFNEIDNWYKDLKGKPVLDDFKRKILRKRLKKWRQETINKIKEVN
jgi:hypothetical protein